jgi:hypothetical protein
MTLGRPILHAILVSALLWTAAPAQAQVTLRAEVVKPLQAAQEQLKAGNPAGALTHAVSARAIAHLTAAEKVTVERIVATAAINAKDQGTAREALTFLSGEASLPPGDRLAFQETLIGLLRLQGDMPGLAKAARQYLDQGGTKAGTRSLYLQALSAQNLHADVVEYLNPLLQHDKSATLSEPEARVLAIAQRSVKNEAGYYDALKRLVQSAPTNQDYWGTLLAQVKNLPQFDARHELDLARLMAHRQALTDANDHLYYAQLALKAGYPIEAQRALDAGVQAKAFSAEADAANLDKLRRTVQRKIAEDAPLVQALEKKAGSGQQQAELAEILFSKAEYPAAVKMYRAALQSSALRREDELRLHLAVALELSGQRSEAKEQLAAIQSSATAKELGALWTLVP